MVSMDNFQVLTLIDFSIYNLLTELSLWLWTESIIDWNKSAESVIWQNLTQLLTRLGIPQTRWWWWCHHTLSNYCRACIIAQLSCSMVRGWGEGVEDCDWSCYQVTSVYSVSTTSQPIHSLSQIRSQYISNSQHFLPCLTWHRPGV